MNSLLQVLKEYNGAIGMAAILIFSSTLIFTVSSFEKSLQDIIQPYVVLYLTKLQEDESINYFVLENFGKKAALNIAVRTNPELKIEFPKDHPFPLFFDNRISVLAPAQRIVSALPPGEYVNLRYDCTIIYQNDENRIFAKKQIIDFGYTKNLLFSPSPENRIAKNTEKIAHLLEKRS
ncbi:MAG: hypothetical protein AWM53_00832 [Candidatus Dichloromethanomonas elyunquensis]|nr:MAG: hypothetical protein AWM53_00832 [Candidatus Dichloromethanomonas elyunquensis]